MIARLEGRVVAAEPGALVVDVGGVGYLVHVPDSVVSAVGGLGQPVVLHTHLHVRDAELTLYGTADPEGLRLFQLLLTVSGVGPRLALALLGAMDAGALLACIDGEDVDRLTSVPGVGKKTAQRIIFDLRGKLPDHGGAIPLGGPPDEALLALTGLGYTPAEAKAALASVGGPEDATVEERLRAALRLLATQ